MHRSIFTHIFENAGKMSAQSADNVHVVSFRRVRCLVLSCVFYTHGRYGSCPWQIRHAKLSYGIDATPVTAVAPLQTFRSLAYALQLQVGGRLHLTARAFAAGIGTWRGLPTWSSRCLVVRRQLWFANRTTLPSHRGFATSPTASSLSFRRS